MKNALVIFACVILSLNMNAQVELLHSFDQSVGYVNIGNEIGFYSYDYTSDELTIFNPDYTEYKSVILNISEGYEVYAILHMSDKLFKLDEAIEFVLVIWDGIDDYSMKLYNENQEVLFDFGNRYYSWIIWSNGKYCLQVREVTHDETMQTYYYRDDMYSLPGSLPMQINNSKNVDLGNPYPNPTNQMINIPYKLEVGQSTNLVIFNANGQLIEKRHIDGNHDRLRLDVGAYPGGVYLYEYNGISNRFMVK